MRRTRITYVMASEKAIWVPNIVSTAAEAISRDIGTGLQNRESGVYQCRSDGSAWRFDEGVDESERYRQRAPINECLSLPVFERRSPDPRSPGVGDCAAKRQARITADEP